MRPPIPKPNDPVQMHTWRQIAKIKDNYISRLENRLSPKKQRNEPSAQKPRCSTSQGDVVGAYSTVASDFDARPTDHSQMPTAELSRKLSIQKKRQGGADD